MPKSSKVSPRIALVYDRVNTTWGGAEKLLLALHQIYPQAPLFTSVYDPVATPWASIFDIRTSFLQKLPGAKSRHRFLACLMPLAFESLDFSQFDLIITITSAEAKGIITKPDQLHVCYLLSPPRYLWSHRDLYQQFPLLGWIIRIVQPLLAWWDLAAAHRPDVIIPISKLSQRRCGDYYHRTTDEPLYPTVISAVPVGKRQINKYQASKQQVKNFVTSSNKLPTSFYLVVSRLVVYKRIDLVITACTNLGLSLVIVGDGPEKNKLEELAKDTKSVTLGQITFLGNQSEEVVAQLYRSCQAVIMAGEEDFGLTALEAWAVGAPVLLHRHSGAAEILGSFPAGILISAESTSSLTQAIHQCQSTSFDRPAIAQWARKYDTLSFQKQFHAKIESLWQSFLAERKS